MKPGSVALPLGCEARDKRAQGQKATIPELQQRKRAGYPREPRGPAPAGQAIPDGNKGAGTREKVALRIADMKPAQRHGTVQIIGRRATGRRDIDKAQRAIGIA